MLAVPAGRALAEDKTIDGGDWFTGPWTPAGAPTAADDATISSGIGPVVTLSSPGAVALTLDIATSFRGRLDMSAGTLDIGDRFRLGATGGSSLGEFHMSGGTLDAESIVVGDVGGGFFIITGGSKVTTRGLIVANGAGSFYEKLAVQSGTSSVTVDGDEIIGYHGPGTYTLSKGTNSVVNLFIGAAGSDGTGVYRIDSGGSLTVDKGFIGGSTAADGVVGTLFNNGGKIASVNPGSEIIVAPSKARLYGAGIYDIQVTYQEKVNIHFPQNTLSTATLLKETKGLTIFNSGPGDATTVLAAKMLPDTMYNIKWGGIPGPANIIYDPKGPTSADRPTLTMSYPAASISGITGVPAANIEPRLRFLQLGTDITSLNGSISSVFMGDRAWEIRSLPRNIDMATATAAARSQNVGGEFDVAIMGVATVPKHQNPNIATLHDAPNNLTGEGVIIGQLEPGLPYPLHGAFDDWSDPDPTKLRLQLLSPSPGFNNSSYHSTAVASSIIGFDPLGIQVEGFSHLAATADRYNGGFGFTGVAPKAKLYSINWQSNNFSEFRTLAGTTEPLPGGGVNSLKIINMSAGYSQDGTGVVPDGTNIEERVADHFIESNGIIFVKSAGNDGDNTNLPQQPYRTISTPGGTYNGIVVGNAVFDLAAGKDSYPKNFDVAHATLEPSSSRGPTSEPLGFQRRAKPDLVAQGTGNLMAFTMTEVNASGSFVIDPAYPEYTNVGLYGTRHRDSSATNLHSDTVFSGTSFAAPQVSGVAALMVQRARAMGSAAAEDPRVVKSILQTSADKPATWEKGELGNGLDNRSDVPLSYDWGAGLLDPVGAINLLNAGQKTHGPARITSDGWNLAHLDQTDYEFSVLLPGHAYILDDLKKGSPFTATLNWYRHVDASYTASPLKNLDLKLYRFDGILTGFDDLVALSDSKVDNVEHVFIPSLAKGGDYILQVWRGDLLVDNEDYAVSWDLTLDPTSSGTGGSGKKWKTDGGGLWGVDSNWIGGVPDAIGEAANFTDALTSPNAPAHVQLDVLRTVGSLKFDNANTYILEPGTGGSLRLDNGAAEAIVTVLTGSHIVAVPVEAASDTNIRIAGGASLSISADVSVAATKTLTKEGSGPLTVSGAITLNGGALVIAEGPASVGRVRGGSLTLASGTTLAILPNGSAAGTSQLASVTIAGAAGVWEAKLDLTDNDLIVQATALTRDSVLATLTEQIRSARNVPGGLWTSQGVTSSAAAADPRTGLAIALNDTGAGTPLFPIFDGLAADANAILIKYTYNGDADFSGKIDADDYFKIDKGFLVGATGYRNGDFDYSGSVDADDYFLIDSAYLNQSGVLGIGEPASAAAVPEPAPVGLLFAGLLGFFARRWPRQRD
jgi:hypothetical protein